MHDCSVLHLTPGTRCSNHLPIAISHFFLYSQILYFAHIVPQVEIRMLQYLSRKFATTHRISIERLVSGNGLANVSIKLASHHINNGRQE